MRIVISKTFSSVFMAVLFALPGAVSHAAVEEAPGLNEKQTAELFTYDRIYIGKDGHSHFDQVTLNFKKFQYAADVPHVWADTSGMRPANGVIFMATPTGWDGTALHPPQRRQLFIVLTGSVAFTTSDGDKRILHPGQVILMEDHKGIGHGSYNAAQGIGVVMAVGLPDDDS